MQFSSTLLLCVAASAYAAAEPRAQGKAKDDGIVVALFTDANSRDSRADFTVGKWDFEGFAEWPIHEVKQKSSESVECRYSGAKSGVYTIRGTGVGAPVRLLIETIQANLLTKFPIPPQ